MVDVVYIRQETEARDPFTRDKRPISNEPKDEVEIQFRHDIPSWRFNYVVDYRWRGKTFRYDLNFVDTNRDATPRIFVTAQYQLRRGLTLYAQIRTLLDFERTLVRERYEGGIADGNLLQIEERSRTFRQEFIAGFRGQF